MENEKFVDSELTEEKGAKVGLIQSDIYTELLRAYKKHPTWPKDKYRQLGIVSEEHGETWKALLHLDYEGGSKEHLREEAIQTAAMCLRFLLNLD